MRPRVNFPMHPIKLAFTLCILATCTACGSHRGSSGSAPAPQATSVRVVTATVLRGSIQPRMVVPGAIAPHQIVAISNALNEPTAAVYVEEGDHVEAGQPLAQLNVDDLQAGFEAASHTAAAQTATQSQTGYNAQLAQAQAPALVHQSQAQLTQAQQTLIEAQSNLKRDETLYAPGFLPQQNLDEQRVVVANDQAAIASANASLRSSLATQYATGTKDRGLQASAFQAAGQTAAALRSTALQLQREISRGTIVSPIEGFVVNRNLNPGEYPSGRQLFTIEQTSSVYAVLTASAIQADAMTPGDTVEVTRIGLPGRRFIGHIVTVLDAAVPGSTNFAVKVVLSNPDHALRAGMTVQATVDLRPVRGLVIPIAAFTDDSRGRLLVVAHHRAHMVQVQEVATDGLRSVVNGVGPNMRVIISAPTDVRDGQNVDDRT